MKRMISGIKPTGKLTLGNYLGAIKPFVEYQDEYELFVFIADLHALTTEKDPDELRRNASDLLAIYIAAGLDPDKCVIFRQSDVPAHNQLEWVLTCNTDLPDLTKMPQYKNYCQTHQGKATPTGMLIYPVLMASDILLSDADIVPCGQDQVSHVLLTNTIAKAFNKRYGDTFKQVKPQTPKIGAKIMSLTDPTKKMSKSESDAGTIYLLDDLDVSRKKIMRALTDSENKIYFDAENKPGVSNLMTIYSAVSGMSLEEIEREYASVSDYGAFKRDLWQLLEKELSELQTRVSELKKQGTLDSMLAAGAAAATKIANEKIKSVYTAIGLR